MSRIITAVLLTGGAFLLLLGSLFLEIIFWKEEPAEKVIGILQVLLTLAIFLPIPIALMLNLRDWIRERRRI